MLLHQNHGAGGGNGSIMVGMFVCLCLASQNPFEQEFFVPARTDLGVKLLINRKNNISSTFNGIDLSHIMLADCCVQQRRGAGRHGDRRATAAAMVGV
jgi:hypothetical protein